MLDQSVKIGFHWNTKSEGSTDFGRPLGKSCASTGLQKEQKLTKFELVCAPHQVLKFVNRSLGYQNEEAIPFVEYQNCDDESSNHPWGNSHTIGNSLLRISSSTWDPCNQLTNKITTTIKKWLRTLLEYFF